MENNVAQVLNQERLQILQQLAEIKKEKDELSERLDYYNKKAGMIRETLDTLSMSEADLLKTLEHTGVYQDIESSQPLIMDDTGFADLISREQLNAMLSDMFVQPVTSVQPQEQNIIKFNSGRTDVPESGISIRRR